MNANIDFNGAKFELTILYEYLQRCDARLLLALASSGGLPLSCPRCGSPFVSWYPTRGSYMCVRRHWFGTRTGTCIEGMTMPIPKALALAWVVQHGHELPVYWLAHLLGVRWETARDALRRLRKAKKDGALRLHLSHSVLALARRSAR